MTAPSAGRKSAGKLFGTERLRVEDPRLLRGDARFVADVTLHGMLHVAFVRSPLAHARIQRVDPQEALRMPGVVDVLTADMLAHRAHIPLAWPQPQFDPFLHPVLATDEVCYVGQPVAAVVATDRHLAEDAAELVDVEYDPLPVVVDPEAALTVGAPLVSLARESNLAARETIATGDPAALASAPHRIRKRFRIPRQAGVPLEGRGVVADWDPAHGELRMWTSTQGPHQVRDLVADQLGVDPESVQVRVPDVGGAFGVKYQVYPEELVLAVLARRIGSPVKWIEDRAEHLQATTQGREQVHDVEIGFDDEGRILAVHDEIISPFGAYAACLVAEEASLTMALLRGLYRIPNFSASAAWVATNTAWTGPFRAVGHSQAVLVIERLIDEIADRLELDPVGIRMLNLIGPAEMPADRGVDCPMLGRVRYESGDFPEALRQVAELADLPGLRRSRAAARAEGRHVGIGIATYAEATAIGPFETATVRITPTGTVIVGLGASSSGQGHRTAFAQIAADVLEVGFDEVSVVAGDTRRIRTGAGAYASRSAAVQGAAVLRAGEGVRDQALRIAAAMLEVDESDLVVGDGGVQVVGAPSTRLTYGEIAARVAPGQPLPLGIDRYELEWADHFIPPAPSFSYGAMIAVVEVDAETGYVEPRLIALVHDAGRLINPMIVRGQLHGGIALGIGSALLEDVGYSADGQPATSFLDYLLPDAATVPEIRLGHLAIPTTNNPHGSRGVGEAGVIAVPAAVANAVADALRPLRVDVTELPLTPQRVLGLITAARSRAPDDAHVPVASGAVAEGGHHEVEHHE